MKNDKLFVKRSSIEGTGLFTNQRLVRGQIAFILKGEMVHRMIKSKADALRWPNHVGIDKDTWIDPAEPFVNINHSCNPNLGTKGRVLFTALRDIKVGEELTFDYSISEDSFWEMKCFCGERNCRKLIRGMRYLPVDRFKKYYPYIPTYFRNLYEREVLKLKL